jgi:hypothetical protein
MGVGIFWRVELGMESGAKRVFWEKAFDFFLVFLFWPSLFRKLRPGNFRPPVVCAWDIRPVFGSSLLETLLLAWPLERALAKCDHPVSMNSSLVWCIFALSTALMALPRIMIISVEANSRARRILPL